MVVSADGHEFRMSFACYVAWTLVFLEFGAANFLLRLFVETFLAFHCFQNGLANLRRTSSMSSNNAKRPMVQRAPDEDEATSIIRFSFVGLKACVDG